MFVRRKGQLARLRSAREGRAVQFLKGVAGDPYSREFDALADPGRRELNKFTDEDLAELIACEPRSKQGLLATSIMASRDSWRTPGKWALFISAVSLAVSIGALVVSILT